MANSDLNGSRNGLPFNVNAGFFPMFQNPSGNHRGLLMTHTVSSPRPTPAQGGGMSVGGMSLNRHLESRTAEGSRLLRDNLLTVMEELRPLVERARTADTHGISLSSWLRRSPVPRAAPAGGHAGGSVSITVESDQAAAGPSTAMQADNAVNNMREAAAAANVAPQPNPAHNNNNNNVTDEGELLRQSPETRAFLTLSQKYIPFLLILIAKGIYDHRAGILIFIGLFVTFSHANAVVKREIAKQSRRSLVSLLVIVCNLMGCICFIYYIFLEQKLYLSLVFIPPYSQPLSMWDLLWMVGVTDFVLKLITIIVKVGFASLPVMCMPYQRRGKVYLLIESSSQLYRSLAPIQPWLYYLLESYQGPEKVVGVFLSAAYMVSKGADLLARVKLWRGAFWQVLQHVNLGVSPSKEQLQTAGQQCPICHDDFDTPVLLHCRHIFCETCVATWFDREQTCPLCRAKVVDDPSWRDGSTTYFSQLY